MKPIYTTIPVGLCEYALLNKKVNHLKLYIYLKHTSEGYIPHDPQLYKYWATDIECSKRWVYQGLQWLIKNKWITVNSKRNVLHIIGYKQLCKKLGIHESVAVVYEPEDFSRLKEFCAGALTTYYLRKKAWMDKKRRPVSLMDDTTMSRNFYPKGFYSLPVRYLSKCIDISPSTANNYKQQALKGGFIEVKKQLITLIDNKGRKLSKDKISVYKQIEHTNCGRLRLGTKYLKIVDSDLIKSLLIMKRKRFKYDAKK